MSRAGYSDDLDNWQWIKWRGQVASAIRGKRGQAFLRELLAALDSLPEKKLVAQEFEAEGAVCALGSVARQRGVDLSQFDPEDYEVGERIGAALGIAQQLAREIMYENDEFRLWDPGVGRIKDPDREAAARWEHMRAWVVKHLRTPENGTGGRDG